MYIIKKYSYDQAKKLNNVITYLHSLDIQKSELADDTYIQLINEEIDFYKKKVYDYSNLYENYT